LTSIDALNRMFQESYKSPSILLSFNVATVLLRWST